MSKPEVNHRESDDSAPADLRRAIEDREKRLRLWRQKGERSVARNLAIMGVLGWLMVAPMLLGALLGRWLDRLAGEGVMWTAALIFGGCALGGYLVWRRIAEEPE